MDKQKEEAILNLVASARQRSEAFIVVGILPGHRFFYSVDPNITIPDLHGVLQDNIDDICNSVARKRAREINERPIR
jgi:hypothetical protein